jgi:7-carboxy-7-deazaguanine synthase
MRGDNPLRPQEFKRRPTTMGARSFLYTLQGEGPFAGQPAVFVRLAGCNLSCFWCDTEFESSTWRPRFEGADSRYRESTRPPFCQLIVLTGGEPFRQNIAPLLEKHACFERQAHVVQIETNGTLYVELPESKRIHIVCSPKTASLNQRLLPKISSYKYLIAAGQYDSADGLPIESTQRGRRDHSYCQASQALVEDQRSLGVFVMPIDTGSVDWKLLPIPRLQLRWP